MMTDGELTQMQSIARNSSDSENSCSTQEASTTADLDETTNKVHGHLFERAVCSHRTEKEWDYRLADVYACETQLVTIGGWSFFLKKSAGALILEGVRLGGIVFLGLAVYAVVTPLSVLRTHFHSGTADIFEKYWNVNCELHLAEKLTGLTKLQAAKSISAIVADKIDLYVWAHLFGWLFKGLIIRDLATLTVTSVLFEFLELSLRHIQPNFAECWWDSWILDVLGCNLFGAIAGIAIGRLIFPQNKNNIASLSLSQKWLVVAALSWFDIQFFFLKCVLAIEPDNPFMLFRLVVGSLAGAVAAEELSLWFANKPRLYPLARSSIHNVFSKTPLPKSINVQNFAMKQMNNPVDGLFIGCKVYPRKRTFEGLSIFLLILIVESVFLAQHQVILNFHFMRIGPFYFLTSLVLSSLIVFIRNL